MSDWCFVVIGVSSKYWQNQPEFWKIELLLLWKTEIRNTWLKNWSYFKFIVYKQGFDFLASKYQAKLNALFMERKTVLSVWRIHLCSLLQRSRIMNATWQTTTDCLHVFQYQNRNCYQIPIMFCGGRNPKFLKDKWDTWIKLLWPLKMHAEEETLKSWGTKA